MEAQKRNYERHLAGQDLSDEKGQAPGGELRGCIERAQHLVDISEGIVWTLEELAFRVLGRDRSPSPSTRVSETHTSEFDELNDALVCLDHNLGRIGQVANDLCGI